MSVGHYAAGKPHFVGKFPPAPDVRKLVAFWNTKFPSPTPMLPEPQMMDQPDSGFTNLQVPGAFDRTTFTEEDYRLWARTCRELSVERGSLVCLPRVEPTRPEGRLFLPRHVTLWVSKPCRDMLSPWEAEDYTEYRVRQCEEAVLGKSRQHELDIARRKRGIALALDLRIKHLGNGLWNVPSSGAGETRTRPIDDTLPPYLVDMKKGTCTCPDYKGRKLTCKHQYAIEHLQATQQTMWETEYSGVFAGVDLAMDAAFTAKMIGFSMIGAVSGRFSTKGPNFHPMPRSERPPSMVVNMKALDKLFAQPIAPILPAKTIPITYGEG